MMKLSFEEKSALTSKIYDIKYKAGCLMMHRGIDDFGKGYDTFLDTISEFNGKAYVFGVTERQYKYFSIKAKAQFAQLPKEVQECYIEAAKECSLDMTNLIEACI